MPPKNEKPKETPQMDEIKGVIESVLDERFTHVDDKFEQLSRQLGEVVARLGRMERGPVAVSMGPVTKDEAERLGSRFWMNIDTGGVRTAVPVERVPGHEDDGYGNISYRVRRTDISVHQGPSPARAIDQLFHTREEAESAPRTSSSAKRRKVTVPK